MLDLTALWAEVRSGRRAGSSTDSGSETSSSEIIDLRYPQGMHDDIFQEIPFHDPSYAAIDGVLIESNSSLGIRLCRFKTFQGLEALQPCIYDDEQVNMFNALAEWESTGHQIYKDARLWACMAQSKPNLPTPCRWLAATIFNFASDMLRPDNTQDFMWNMRSWLEHWLNVARLVFEELDAPVFVPELDWFQQAYGSEHTTSVATLEEAEDDSTSSNGTVVHHVLRPEAPEFIPGLATTP